MIRQTFVHFSSEIRVDNIFNAILLSGIHVQKIGAFRSYISLLFILFISIDLVKMHIQVVGSFSVLSVKNHHMIRLARSQQTAVFKVRYIERISNNSFAIG